MAPDFPSQTISPIPPTSKATTESHWFSSNQAKGLHTHSARRPHQTPPCRHAHRVESQQNARIFISRLGPERDIPRDDFGAHVLGASPKTNGITSLLFPRLRQPSPLSLWRISPDCQKCVWRLQTHDEAQAPQRLVSIFDVDSVVNDAHLLAAMGKGGWSARNADDRTNTLLRGEPLVKGRDAQPSVKHHNAGTLA